MRLFRTGNFADNILYNSSNFLTCHRLFIILNKYKIIKFQFNTFLCFAPVYIVRQITSHIRSHWYKPDFLSLALNSENPFIKTNMFEL